MTTNAPDTNESTDPRTTRALQQYLTVLEDAPEVDGADGLYVVVSESGEQYLVDARDGVCECPDHKHRDVRCKHLRRVAFATGDEPIPAGVDGVDDHLGAHVAGAPRVAVPDGGVLEAGDDGKILDEDTEGGRPEDCDCGAWNAGDRVTLPCWPCYRAGFDEPNPDAED